MTVAEIFEQHRSLVFGIAYRMLGSVVEAEDITQDVFLRWQRQPTAPVQSAKAYLTTIVTRLCIDHLRSAQHQREQYVGVWLPEPRRIAARCFAGQENGSPLDRHVSKPSALSLRNWSRSFWRLARKAIPTG